MVIPGLSHSRIGGGAASCYSSAEAIEGHPNVLSFVTVVYSKDFPLLELQARSMAKFADFAKLASIHVVLNDRDEVGLRARVDRILEAYGPLREKVRLVRGDEVLLGPGQCKRRTLSDRVLIENRFRLPFIRKGGWRGNNGYRAQQVLKLGSARVASAEQMVILDAKNLFLRAFDEADFFSPSGAARIPFIPVVTDFHRNWLLQSLDALGEPAPDLDVLRTTTFSTPFPVRRSLVLDLLKEINARYDSVQALFASRRRPSEFMLLNAYCLRSDPQLRPWFEEAPSTSAGLWPTFDAAEIAQFLDRLDAPETLSLGLHNRAITKLPLQVQERIFSVLENRGISDRETTKRVLDATSALTG